MVVDVVVVDCDVVDIDDCDGGGVVDDDIPDVVWDGFDDILVVDVVDDAEFVFDVTAVVDPTVVGAIDVEDVNTDDKSVVV